MTLQIYTITVDATDPGSLAEFWAAALGYQPAYGSAEEVAIEATGDSAVPALLFVRSIHPKRGKNRVHLDLNPSDQAQEVQRLIDLGARKVDIGQRDVPWAVLQDPEGNEFCVLTPRE